MQLRSKKRHRDSRIWRLEQLEAREMLAADAIITEFLAVNHSGLRDEDGDHSDWLELANHGDQPLSLGGWYLTDSVNDLTRWRIPDVTLSPGTHRVIFASGKDRVDGAQTLHTNFRLDGDGEPLLLVEPDGTTIADGFWPSFPPQVADVSYGRFGPARDIGYFAQPTPGSVNSRPPTALLSSNIVISEIMYHPASHLDEHEFIELTNAGTMSVSLGGWSIQGGIDMTLPAITVEPGQSIVIAANPEAFATVYSTTAPVIGPWEGWLSNQGETLTVVDEQNRQVDQVRYADEGEWGVRARGAADRGHLGWTWLDDHDGGGKSLELFNPAMPNEYGQNWSASITDGGTPGRTNSIAASNIAPLIVDVTQSPLIPHSDDAVGISVRLLDEANASLTATLHWRVDGSATFQQTPLRDDGQAGDIAANDGVFRAVVPAQPDRTVIEYFVSAADASGNVRSWPAPTRDAGQVTNALYQVMDDMDPEATWEPGRPAVYFQIMTAAERAEFTAIHRLSDAQMNATFLALTSSGIEQRHNAGIRIRGSGSRSQTPPNNRINLASDRPWMGVTALNMQVVNVHNQVAGSLLFQLAGLPAAGATTAMMFSNGVNLRGDGGLYAHLEPLNGDFVDKHFPLDRAGNLYKGNRASQSPPGGQGAGLGYHGPDPLPYSSYGKLTNESLADWSDIIELTNVLNNSPDETFLADVAQIADIDQWLRFFAMNALLGNTEGGLATGDRQGDDYVMYRGIENTQFQMIPHDLDSILAAVTWPLMPSVNVPALARLILHPEVRPRYFQQMLELVETIFESANTEALLREHLRGVASDAQLDSMLRYFQRRAGYVRSQIPVGIQVTTGRPLVNGRVDTTETGVGLYGVADYRANSVLINGRLANFDRVTGQWQFGSFNSDLIPYGAEWQYLDDGSDQGSAWREIEFAPTAPWRTGPSQLGYGDGDEATVVQFGTDPANKPITTYFRYEFQVDDPTHYHTLVMNLVRDDGAVVYLNGQEVVRSNLPAGELDFQTLASSEQSGNAERQIHTFPFDLGLLRTGKNVLAVEVHQASVDSDDLSFHARLFGRYHPPNGGAQLAPGVNRVVIQAMSGASGDGEVVATEFVDAWRDTGQVQLVDSDLATGTTTWTANAGPYQVRGKVTVPADATLVIQPGTAVHFEAGAELVVEGTLVARGTAQQRIRFTTVPGVPDAPDLPGLPNGPPRWRGIHFVSSRSPENIIAFADIEFAQDNNGSVGVINSDAVIEHITVRGTHLRMIYGQNASLVVRHSEFPDMFPGDEDPIALGLDNVAEHIKIVGRTPAGGQLIIQGNRFGTNKGHNDVIDADSNRVTQGPILQILDNVFTGVGDELLDLGGDVLVAGNLFQRVFKDDSTSDRGYANAISTGDAGANTTIVVTRNVFHDVDHAINLKNAAATIFEYNTVVTIHPDFIDRFGHPNVGSAINLYVDEPGATPGKGAYAGHNIFWDLPRVFGNADLPAAHRSSLQLVNNVLSPEVSATSVGTRTGTILNLGSGNIVGDPRLRDPSKLDFGLAAGSAAIVPGAFPVHGAVVADAAWIQGVPGEPTAQRNITLQVGGPGLFAFRYRVNNGPWSDAESIGTGFDPAGTVRTGTIQLSGLADGEYSVEVLGRDFAGNWQTEASSARFTVNANAPAVRINEILADNQQTRRIGNVRPDLIELHNTSDQAVDLRGWRLTDDLSRPARFVFSQNTPIAAGGYLVLQAGGAPDGTLDVGFGLSRRGESLYLLRPDGSVADQISFGLQLPDQSLGRAADGSWQLSQPTFGAVNVPTLTGDPGNLRINEWLAGSETSPDFLELVSLDPLPINLGNLWISDAGDGTPQRHAIPPHSFVAGNGFVLFGADADAGDNVLAMPFGLSLHQDSLRVSHPDGSLIDAVTYPPQTFGYSQGRSPDGTAAFTSFAIPSPGWINGAGSPGDLIVDGVLDHADLALLCQGIRFPDEATAPMDLDRDGQVDRADLRQLVEVLMGTSFGDANLDGTFNSRDLVLVFQAGQYEDSIAGNSTWITGDWNCDGEFNSSDLVLAFQSGVYSANAQRHDAALADWP
jgi:hypothetical protein